MEPAPGADAGVGEDGLSCGPSTKRSGASVHARRDEQKK